MITQEDNKKTPLLRAEEFNNEDGNKQNKNKEGKKNKKIVFIYLKNHVDDDNGKKKPISLSHPYIFQRLMQVDLKSDNAANWEIPQFRKKKKM